MIGEPPSDAGAVHDTVASPSPATAVTLVGAPGTVGAGAEVVASTFDTLVCTFGADSSSSAMKYTS